jgi:hypothetical protein
MRKNWLARDWARNQTPESKVFARMTIGGMGSVEPSKGKAKTKTTVPSAGGRILNRRQSRENGAPSLVEASNSNKISFVPLSLAESTVKQVQEDYVNTSLRHSQATEQLLITHAAVEKHYQELITETKQQAVQGAFGECSRGSRAVLLGFLTTKFLRSPLSRSD